MLACVVVLPSVAGGDDDDDPLVPDAVVAPHAPPDIPMISDALADQCGADTPGPGVRPGDDLHEVVVDDPDAVCNDIHVRGPSSRRPSRPRAASTSRSGRR